jgi:hypothetical protein
VLPKSAESKISILLVLVLVLDLLGIIEVFSVLGRANFPGPEGQMKNPVCSAPSPSLDFIPLP